MPIRLRDEQLLKPTKTKNEDKQIGRLAMHLSAFLLLFMFSAAALWIGFKACRYDWQASREPQPVSLYEIEKGEASFGTYLTIGSHIGLHPVSLDSCYPIFSVEGTMISGYVDTSPGAVFDREVKYLGYRLRKCKFLVNGGPREEKILFHGPITGTIIGRASDLDVTDSRFRNLDLKDPSQIYVIQLDRKPNVWPGTIVMVFGMALMAAAGFFLRKLIKALKDFRYE